MQKAKAISVLQQQYFPDSCISLKHDVIHMTNNYLFGKQINEK